MFAGPIAITRTSGNLDQRLTGERVDWFATAAVLDCKKAELLEIERCGLRDFGQNVSRTECEHNCGERAQSNLHAAI